jgi:hypothetical protein
VGGHHELSLNIGDGKTSIDVQHNIAVNFCRRVKHGEGIKGSKPTSSKNHQATSAPLSTIPKWNPSKTTEIPEIPEDNPESPKKSTGAKSSKTPASEEQNVTSEPPSTKPTEVPITSSEVGVSTEALESSPVPKKTSTLIKSTSAESDDETPTKAQASLNQLAPIEKPTLIEDASDDLVASTDVVKASSPRKPTCTPSQSESVSYDDEDIGNPSEVISTVPPTRAVRLGTEPAQASPTVEQVQRQSPNGDAPLLTVSSINTWYDYINSFLQTAQATQTEDSASSITTANPEPSANAGKRRVQRFSLWPRSLLATDHDTEMTTQQEAEENQGLFHILPIGEAEEAASVTTADEDSSVADILDSDVLVEEQTMEPVDNTAAPGDDLPEAENEETLLPLQEDEPQLEDDHPSPPPEDNTPIMVEEPIFDSDEESETERNTHTTQDMNDERPTRPPPRPTRSLSTKYRQPANTPIPTLANDLSFAVVIDEAESSVCVTCAVCRKLLI